MSSSSSSSSSTSPVWFITAASSGFGEQLALSALQRGHTVVATARNPAKIQHLQDAGAHTLALDVTSAPSELERIASDVFSRHGRVDYLINAAGYILEGAVEEVTAEEVYACFHTNVFGAMNTIRAFLPHMRRSQVVNGARGTVVTFGSLGSWQAGPSYAVYAMTKTSASMLAECLRPELEPFQIRATVVEPGYFRTSFLKPGAKVTAKHRLAAYDDLDTPTGKVRSALDQVNGKQVGDVVKGCELTIDVLTASGTARGKDLPVRIVLGQDCEEAIRGKCRDTTTYLEEWKDAIRSTDHDE